MSDLRGFSSGPDEIQKALSVAIHRSKIRVAYLTVTESASFFLPWPDWPWLPDLNVLRFEIADDLRRHLCVCEQLDRRTTLLAGYRFYCSLLNYWTKVKSRPIVIRRSTPSLSDEL